MLKRKISKITGINESELPGSYQVIGDIVLVKIKKHKKKVAEAILQILPYVKTVCEITEVTGEYRQPRVVKILGKGTETIHKENDILYKIDVAKVMFSKGNLFERKRLLKQIKRNETVVDMFAGIGYFSLGIAKFTKAKVIAIEKNPVAFGFLKENILLNKLKNVRAILGDNRTVSEKADRILMGYFPGTEQFLPSALKMAKKGTIVHYHNVYTERELWKKPLEQINKAGNVEILNKKKVKSVGPRKYHVVIDFKVA